MLSPYETAIGSWTKRSTFFWAATGATVGLSNLWKFPYLASQNGGGLFVLMYLACLLLVTLPLMLTETSIGRSTRHGMVLALDGLIRSASGSRHWVWAGRLSILAGFLVLSFTAVIGAICLAYVFYGALGFFVGASAQDIAGTLSGLVEHPAGYRNFMAWHAIFLGLVVTVAIQGVMGGLERAFRVVVPAFLMLLVGLLGYSAVYGDLNGATDLILGLRPQQLTWQSLQLALTHAFYTLGLGMGVWVVFGSYMPSIAPLKRSVFAVALMDTWVAMMAGLMIYALVFRDGGDGAGQGFALVFLALPSALADAPAGQFVATAIFVLILLVAWTSSLALLEPVIGWFQEWFGAPRGWSAVLMGVATWVAGLGSLYSFNIWADATLAGGTPFRWVELIASGLLIPLVSVALALFVGWYLGRRRAFVLIGQAHRLIAQVWFWVLRLVLPLVILYIGGSYAITSLGSLCEAGQVAPWCRPATGVEPALPAPGEALDPAPILLRPPGPDEPLPEPLIHPLLELNKFMPPTEEEGRRVDDVYHRGELRYQSV
ncbi:sodium-dependent transporter [Marinobacter caseinilyticus]|uniref:sodium-dependent transporter n=1 Tax=Marinobacter caseinilyticus TaxID=2692195 RepID=UPI001A94E7F0|nr:sodium-dependent transporter [Marinobacter caseinilyticus]